MRESRFLKSVSYIAIPILIGILILSFLYGTDKKDYEKQKQEDISYFNTDAFLNDYMTVLSRETENLIYRNEKYKYIQDGDYKIYYKHTYGNGEYIYNIDEYEGIKGFYYVIIYKQKVFTNIELTTKTNTLEKLKTYVSQKNEKTKIVNIINGVVESDSEIIATKAIQFWDNFKNTYYAKPEIVLEDVPVQTQNIVEENENKENMQTDKEAKEELKTEVVDKKEDYIYVTTQMQDFQIYSSYSQETVKEINVFQSFYTNMLLNLEKYEKIMNYAIPVCSAFLISIALYLIISVGHTKGKKGIDLNDFDKLFIEVILIFAVINVFLIMLGIKSIFEKNISYSFVWSCLLTSYIVIYIISIATCTTLVKRIKARAFLKYSIIARFFKIIINFIKNTILKIINVLKSLKENWSFKKVTILYMICYIIISVFIVVIFGKWGIIIDIIITSYVFYKIIEKINSLVKLELHLKKMYEGVYSQKLEEKEFTKEFQKAILYINDISKGFEKTIKERTKSERLKTELITNVSHDIKTPLTSIINYVDLLKKENIQSETVKEYIEILENKSQRLKKLTEDLIEASKASSGNIKLEMRKIKLTELIKQSIGEFEDKFKEKNLEIISNYPKQDIYIMADNRYLYRVVENLYSNIFKYALENSRVYIDVVKEDKKVIIMFKNISKDSLNIPAEELMQRFVRGDKSRTTEGSGLGLSISRSFTELQKGKFDIEVDGDLFKIRLEFDTV